MEERPEYTEYGFKIHKLRLTLKVNNRQRQQEEKAICETHKI